MNTVITPEQCRAARAFLNWSQPELAKRAGITVNPVVNFERETSSQPAARTMKRIVHAFELGGVSFTEHGVEKKQKLISILEGENANFDLLSDIYETLSQAGGGEVLIAGLSEPGSDNSDLRDFIAKHIDRLKEANISERILTSDTQPNIIAPAHWYRRIKDNEFSNTPFQLYADKLALIEWGPPQRIVIIQHPQFVQTFKNMFEQVWKHASLIESRTDGGI